MRSAPRSTAPGDAHTAATANSTGLGPRELLVLISAIMALMALAIDLMLPAFDDIRDAFGIDPDSNQVARVITVFFLGLAVAQVFWGPLADRFGRKPILAAGMTIYTLGAIGSALAPSFGLLLLSRFVWGLGAAGSRVVAVAIIRDTFEGPRMAKAMSQIMAVFMIVPVIAPSLGAVIVAVAPWRSIFWFCVVWVGVVVVWTRRLPETLDPVNRTQLSGRGIARDFRRIARTRITAGYTVATVFLQASFTSWLGSSELIVTEIFGRETQFPLVFGGVAVLFALSAMLNVRVIGRLGVERVVHRALAILVALTTLLVIIAMATDGTPTFWLFMPILALVLATNMFLMPNLNAAAMGPVGDIAGTASSLTGAARMAGGAVFGAMIDSQVHDTITPFAVGLLLVAITASLTIWFIDFPRGGPRTDGAP